MGTSASRAMRAAPVLKSLSSKLRLMVASGYTPTISPARNCSTATEYAPAPARRSTGIVPVCLIRKLTMRTSCISALIMNLNRRCRLWAANAAGNQSR